MSRVGYRHCDPRYPFLWSTPNQPAARWHGDGEGPAHYFADTPVGAWAEFIRHEEIRDVADLEGIQRSLWAVALPETDYGVPILSQRQLTGGLDTYADCQAEAARLRDYGTLRLEAPSAALIGCGARGWVAGPDEKVAPKARDGVVWVLYGIAGDLVAWPAVEAAAPPKRVLSLVRHFV